MMEPIKVSVVHRNLDSKLRLLGMEAQDLVFVMLLASVMNLLFGKSSVGFHLTFVLPGLVAIVLFFVKRGRPDGFLVHLIRYYLTPGFFGAGEDSRNAPKLLEKIYDTEE